MPLVLGEGLLDAPRGPSAVVSLTPSQHSGRELPVDRGIANAEGESTLERGPVPQRRHAPAQHSEAISAPVWKRTLDCICILLALPGVLLVMVSVSALIKIVSPGPVFFKQERVGHRRQRFICWKFRTMFTNADGAVHEQHLKSLQQSGSPLTKMDMIGDPRLIRGGALLRATGLDELPQLINVLRGEMSLVGPRPCTPYEAEGYRPWQYDRFDTLPGLTGLWQVSGKNKTTFAEMVELDIAYAHSKSLWLDLKIMAATASVLASQVKEARSPRPIATITCSRKCASESPIQG
jgi:lipopolysaccharide/colanic/teichoic acid biosynthesis glycosyltransferase